MSKIAVLLIGDIAHDGRVKKEINSLKSLGHDVVLIYSRSNQNIPENISGVQTILVKKKYGGSVLNIVLRNLFFYWKIRRILKKLKPDYVHCNDLNTFIISFFQLKGIKYVYDAHEMNMGIPNLFKEYVLTTMERVLIKNAYAIIVPQIDRLNLIQMKYRLNPEKLFLLENFPSKITTSKTDFFVSEYNFQANGRTILSYSGVMDNDRCVKELILAMKYVDDAVLFLIGNTTQQYKFEIQTLIENNNLEDRIFLKPLVKQEQVISIAQSTDIGLCIYRPVRINNYLSASNKIYEYLSSGTKVISNSTPSMLRIHDPNLLLIDKITPEKIAETIKLAKNHIVMLSSIIEYAWENQEIILKLIYK